MAKDHPTGLPAIRPHTPVPRAVVDDLLVSFAALLPDTVGSPVPALVDPELTALELRRFKLDLSFAAARDGRSTARFSVNDKGEPEALRGRLRAVLPALGVPRDLLDARGEPEAVLAYVSAR